MRKGNRRADLLTDLHDRVDWQSARHREEHQQRKEQGFLEVPHNAIAIHRRQLVQHLRMFPTIGGIYHERETFCSEPRQN